MWSTEAFRKALVLIAMGSSNFSESYMMGHTACLIAGLFQEKEELNLTEDDISWIMSLMYSSMVFGTLLSTLITEKVGRRYTIVFFQVPVVLHWVMLYYARNNYVFSVARLLAGLGFGGTLPMIYMETAECSSPKMRGFNLAVITTVTTAIGSTVGTNLGIVLDWRTASLVGGVMALFSSILPCFCVESPPWLASKGRFEECKIAYTSLHGYTPSAQKELELIIEVETAKLNNRDKTSNSIQLILRELKIAVRKRYFWELMILANVINKYKMICGRILYGSYGIIILQKISGHSDILPYTLVISGVSIAGSGVTGILLKKINVRTLVIPSGFLNSFLLIGLGLSLYFVPEIKDNPIFVWINVVLYITHISLVQILLFPILEAVPSELYPLEIRGACNSIVALISSVVMFAILKTTPAMMALVDMYGVFFINAVAMLIFVLYIWVKLPETRGRTLHEIEIKIKKEIFVKKDFIVQEQMKELI